MDTLHLHSIELWTAIGVTEEERRAPQRILIDVVLHHAIDKTAAHDDVSHGIDYAAVVGAIQALATTERATIERMAEDVASTVIERFRPAGGVTVTVTKHPALPLASARLTIHRP